MCFSIVLLTVGCGKKAEQIDKQELSREQRLPIIDMHMHASWMLYASDGRNITTRPYYPDRSINEPTTVTSDEEVLRLTLAEMDKYNIVKGFLSDDLKNVYRWVAAAPDRFIPSPMINIKTLRPHIDVLRAEYAEGRIKALGEFTTQYYGFAPNDSVLDPYFSLAEELDVPVLIHTLGLGAHLPNFRSSLGHPLLLEDVLVKHPKLRLWVESAGYPFLDEIIALMYMYPQVYADLSTISWIIPRETFHDYFEDLIRADLGKRLMFGSDQMIWPETIGMAVEAIESADFLTEEQKRDILYNNAVRFLRLEEKTH
jgi:predicted TIM-barrel fold metal-dependent hydrolase